MKRLLKLNAILTALLIVFSFAACNADVEVVEPEPEPIPEPKTYYTVTYTTEYGTAPESITVEENTMLSEEQLPSLTAERRVFKGWFYIGRSGEKTKAVAGEYKVTRNVNLSAQWGTSITVSYWSKVGTVPESFEHEGGVDLPEEKLAPISCPPYKFLGWCVAKDSYGNGAGVEVEVYMWSYSNITLYAKWETATVTFESEVSEPIAITKIIGETISEEEIPVLTKDGYTYAGFFNGDKKITEGYTVTGDETFTVKWTPNTYTITFKANGGEGSDHVQTVTYGTRVKLDDVKFTPPLGYEFKYWLSDTYWSPPGSMYLFAESEVTINIASPVVLSAVWKGNATADNIAEVIRNMTESGIIAAEGSFDLDTIKEINKALKSLPEDVMVTLNLSLVTGLTELADSAVTYSRVDDLKWYGHTGYYEEDINSLFFNCKNLSGLILPEGLTSIGPYAFYGCTGLTSVTIPSSVTSIGCYAFYGCAGLTSVTIPNGVTKIEEHTFDGCRALGSVTMDGVTRIGQCAFVGCGFTNLTLPENLTYIGDFAFSSCRLTSVTIPDKVEKIYEEAFSYCGYLTTVSIPASVNFIGLRTFKDCNNLSSVSFADTETIWYKIKSTGSYNDYYKYNYGKMDSDPQKNAEKIKSYDNYGLTTDGSGYIIPD